MSETSIDPLVIMLRNAEESVPQRCSLARQVASESTERRLAIARAIAGKAQPQAIVDALAVFDITTTAKQIERHRYRGCASCEMPGRHDSYGSLA